MSRLRRLKERKNRIKATACGLALSLSIGSIQGLGTYALFTDREDIASELAISTGDVDVELSSNTVKMPALFNGKTITKEFTITNQGTLKQYIKLNISEQLDDGIVFNEWISLYGIQFKTIDENQNEITLTIGEDGYLKDGDASFELDPGKDIKAIVSFTTKSIDNITQESYAGKKFSLNIGVEASQLGIENIEGKGFFDIDEIKYEFTISPIVPNLTFTEDKDIPEDIKIEFGDYIDKPDSMDLIYRNGGFNRNNSPKHDPDHTYKTRIEYKNGTLMIYADVYSTPDKKWVGVTNKFAEDYVIIKFNYDGYSRYFKFNFKYTSTSKPLYLAVQITELNDSELPPSNVNEEELEVSSESEVIEPSNEEIEVPSEVEVVEPSTEELEVPSESEVIESSTEELEVTGESEVVEPSNEQTIEIQSQLDAVEPSKEDEGIQE